MRETNANDLTAAWSQNWTLVSPATPEELETAFREMIEQIAAQHMRRPLGKGFGGDEPFGPKHFHKQARGYPTDKAISNLLQESPDEVVAIVFWGDAERLEGYRLVGPPILSLGDLIPDKSTTYGASVTGRTGRIFVLRERGSEEFRVRREGIAPPPPPPRRKPRSARR